MLRSCRDPLNSNFTPEFYDNLSKVSLTSRAIRELDRRNSNCPASSRTILTSPIKRHRNAKVTALGRLSSSKLALYAEDGGPDLSDLRGYPGPASIVREMASASPADKTQSTNPTSASSKSKRSSAYDTNFDQHLIDHHIYPPFHRFPNGQKAPAPANLAEIRQVLHAHRRSVSPSTVSESAFEEFQLKSTTRSEGTVMRSIVPLLTGGADIPNEGHLPFGNLDSITSNSTVTLAPDFFDGALPGAIDKRVRDALNKRIVPTPHASVPMAPNFFLEAKGPAGTGEVARRQAVLDGAHGSLIIHALQNYLKEQPIYDGNAYAFTATYVDGQLKLYAHYLTPPVNPGERPDQHTTQLRGYCLTGNYDGWLDGTRALRNLRVFAKECRDRFIGIANARVRKLGTDAEAARTEGGDIASTVEGQEGGRLASTVEVQEGGGVSSTVGEPEGSNPLDFYDCREADDEETHETQTRQRLDQAYDDADDTNVSTGFATSFASSFTSVSQKKRQRQSKKPRTPPSPSSTREVKR
ncbi:hypothetical protein F4802DRAFT_30220 [Xylaria palmicola]|nr:hypothetical protein F4802DRAFT_30220 [Xylaria palmicola]